MTKPAFTIFGVLTLFLLGAVLNSPVLGMISFGYVSPKKALESGLQIRYRAAGPKDVWVEVSFPTDEKWKDFAQRNSINSVQLRLENEDSSLGLRTTLRERRSDSGRVSIHFTVERTKLHRVSIWMIRGITAVADVVQMKDFISLHSIDKEYRIVPAAPAEE